MKAFYAALLVFAGSPALGQQHAPDEAPQRRYPLLQPGQDMWPRFDRPRILSAPDWSNPGLYPLAARRADIEGSVTLDLRIGADGLPLACRIARSSGSIELDDPSCDLALQMRFAESEGERTYRARINWLLSDPLPLAPARFTVSLELSAGRVQDCRLRREGAVPREWPRFVCRVVANDPGAFLGAHLASAARAALVIELQPASGSSLPPDSPPAGRLTGLRRIDFEISSRGIGDCRMTENRGFPAARIQYGQCGLFLSQTGLVRGDEDEAPPSGTMVMRAFVE